MWGLFRLPQMEEHRVLSLASSSVFLLTVVVFTLTVVYQGTNPLFTILARHGAPLLLVPVLLPCFSLTRLVRNRLLRRRRVPFFDGWFIHLFILLPYVIMLVGALR